MFKIRPKAITNDAQWEEIKGRWDKYDKLKAEYGDRVEKENLTTRESCLNDEKAPSTASLSNATATTTNQSVVSSSMPLPPAVKVYVRIRPLNEEEKDDGYMEGLASETCLPSSYDKENNGDNTGVVAVTSFLHCSSSSSSNHSNHSSLGRRHNSSSFGATTTTTTRASGSRRESVGGFDGIFGPQSKNEEIFQLALKDDVSKRVCTGGKVNVFCYGHTGSGKTHSMLGYDSEPGLYQLASDLLLRHVDEINSTLLLQDDDKEKLVLNVRFTELYLGEVYDLINDGKKLTLREDRHGNLHIRTAVDVREDGRVHTSDQKASVVQSTEEIIQVLKDGIRRRSVGSSSTHDQSSRSHALLEIEIVNQNVLRARDAVAEADACVHPIGKAADDTLTEMFTKLYNYNTNDNSITAKCDIVAGDEQMSVEEWVRVQEEICNKGIRLELERDHAEKNVENAKAVLHQAYINGHESIGGTITLIDLAGNDADHRDLGPAHTKIQRKESSQINSDLLSLKECIRALALKQKKIPFRNSKLTRVLKSALLPGGELTSSTATTNANHSKTTNVQTVMLSTVSPSAGLEKETMNTIRYAQMVGAKKKKTTTMKKKPTTATSAAAVAAESGPEKTSSVMQEN